jgi:tRNA threonylcarbamoyladenosine biosynthesis protein TsaE
LGKASAKEILEKGLNKTAVVLALQGNLGGGKTTFLQGFAEELNIKDKILSPTFVILKHFGIADKIFSDFYHIDCYRVKNEKDLLELNFKKIISDPKNIVAIEWSERIKNKLPKSIVIIKFEFIGENKRRIVVSF